MIRARIIAVAAGVLAVAACAGNSSPDDRGGGDKGPITIGVINSTTGALGAVGQQEQQGIELAVKEINAAGGVRGRKLETRLIDDKGSISETTAALKRFAEQDHLAVVIGPGITASAQATAPLAERYRIAEVNLVSQPEVAQGKRFVFEVAAPQSEQSQAMVDWAAENVDGKTAALLTSANPYGDLGAKFLSEKAPAKGIAISGKDTYNQEGVDFSPQAGKIKRANPPMVMLFGAGGNSDGLVLKAIRQAGYRGPIIGDLTLSTSQIPDVAGAAAQQVVSLTGIDYASPEGVTRRFIDAYTAEHHAAPSVLTGIAYDSVYMVADALRRAPEVTGESVAAALQTLDYQGVIGRHAYRGDYHGGPDATAFKAVSFDADGEYVAPHR